MKVAISDEMRDVNQCLAQYDVVIYRGADGKLRIYGDINRTQGIIFGPCLAMFVHGSCGVASTRYSVCRQGSSVISQPPNANEFDAYRITSLDSADDRGRRLADHG